MKVLILLTAIAYLVSCGSPKKTTKRISAAPTPAPAPAPSGTPIPGDPIPGDPRSSTEIDLAFDSYIEEWEALHPESKKVTTPMSFTDIPEEGVLGVCITWVKGNIILREIRIDRHSYLAEMGKDSTGPHTIIFHELGHCELIRPHIELVAQADGRVIPFSIMFPSLFPDVLRASRRG